MKTFELVKEYPCSPELGTKVNRSSMVYHDHEVESNPEFWKEVTNGFRVMTYKGPNNEIYRRADEYNFSRLHDQSLFPETSFDERYKILSVQRLNDNEHFTIHDSVTTQYQGFSVLIKIASFSIKESTIIVYGKPPNNVFCYLEDIEPIKMDYLFITADGYSIQEGDSYYYINQHNQIISARAHEFSGQEEDYHYFKNIIFAKYFLENELTQKTTFTEAEIIKAINKNTELSVGDSVIFFNPSKFLNILKNEQ